MPTSHRTWASARQSDRFHVVVTDRVRFHLSHVRTIHAFAIFAAPRGGRVCWRIPVGTGTTTQPRG